MKVSTVPWPKYRLPALFLDFCMSYGALSSSGLLPRKCCRSKIFSVLYNSYRPISLPRARAMRFLGCSCKGTRHSSKKCSFENDTFAKVNGYAFRRSAQHCHFHSCRLSKPLKEITCSPSSEFLSFWNRAPFWKGF